MVSRTQRAATTMAHEAQNGTVALKKRSRGVYQTICDSAITGENLHVDILP